MTLTRFSRCICRRTVRKGIRSFCPQWDVFEDRTLLSTFLVTTAADNGDDSNPVPGSLRQAILDVNNDTSNTGTDTIDFNIPGTGAQIIQPVSDLPTLTQPVFIDGYSQPGSSPNTQAIGDNAVLLIELDGSGDSTSGATGISFAAAGCTLEGLNVNGFSGVGIAGSDAVIQGNFIGTDPTGTLSMPNGIGVDVDSTLVGINGGDASPDAERNIISGNSLYGVDVGSNCTVAGNYIGTDLTGEVGLGNGPGGFTYGVKVGGPDNIIGTNGDGIGDGFEGNVISGNGIDGGDAGYSAGIYMGLNATGSVVAGNFIGTDALGTSALGNSVGIDLFAGRVGADGSDIDPVAERNVISGNLYAGVWVFGSNCVVAGNYIGTDVTGEVALSNGSATGEAYGVVLQGNDNIIGTNGDGIGDAFERNIISGQFGDGIIVGDGSYGNVIAGDYIGTDKTGTIALGNGTGINLGGDSGTRVGVDGHDPYLADERNIISGNRNGIDLYEGSNDVIAGNVSVRDSQGHAQGNARLLTRYDQGRRAAVGYVRIQSDHPRLRRLIWSVVVVAPRDADPDSAPSVATPRLDGSARVRDAPAPNGPAAGFRGTPDSSPQRAEGSRHASTPKARADAASPPR